MKKLVSHERIPAENIIKIIKQFDAVKDLLAPTDIAEFISSEDTRTQFVQSSRIDIKKLEEEAAKEIFDYEDPSRILLVKKPDYLGNSQWLFQYDGKNLNAAIEDLKWLTQFQEREVDVRPGDALRCRVRIQTAYSEKSTVIFKRCYIEQVIDIIKKGDLGGSELPEIGFNES